METRECTGILLEKNSVITVIDTNSVSDKIPNSVYSTLLDSIYVHA